MSLGTSHSGARTRKGEMPLDVRRRGAHRGSIATAGTINQTTRASIQNWGVLKHEPWDGMREIPTDRGRNALH